jgi:hypothetical protein
VGLVPISWRCLLFHGTLLATFRCVCSLLSLLFRIYRAAYPGSKAAAGWGWHSSCPLHVAALTCSRNTSITLYDTQTFGTVVTKTVWPFPVQVESCASELLRNIIQWRQVLVFGIQEGWILSAWVPVVNSTICSWFFSGLGTSISGEFGGRYFIWQLSDTAFGLFVYRCDRPLYQPPTRVADQRQISDNWRSTCVLTAATCTSVSSSDRSVIRRCLQ